MREVIIFLRRFSKDVSIKDRYTPENPQWSNVGTPRVRVQPIMVEPYVSGHSIYKSFSIGINEGRIDEEL